VAFAASMIGDCAWYVAGRQYGRRVMTTLCRISLSPDSCVRETENRFERWGGLTLVLGKFIPGLATITPPLAGPMRIRCRSFLPPDRDVIFYCTCPNEASAARAAKRLIDRGYAQVRPLLGGLEAWTAAGYAIELRTPAPRGS